MISSGSALPRLLRQAGSCFRNASPLASLDWAVRSGASSLEFPPRLFFPPQTASTLLEIPFWLAPVCARAMHVARFSSGAVARNGAEPAAEKEATPEPIADPKDAAFHAETLTHKDSSLQDAQMIFDLCWQNLEKEHGRENLAFPKELIFLGGAPGSGKGTMSGLIRKERDIAAPAVEVSALLQGEKMQRIKDAGGLVGDQDVLQALLEELLKPEYSLGVVIDGFPRTRVQAQTMKLWYDKMKSLRQQYADDPVLRHRFRRPIFRICVLYVNEETSVRRQLARAVQLELENAKVLDTGMGRLRQARATDVDEELAKQRYRVFKEEVYDALKLVKDHFFFHFLDAGNSPEVVRDLIVKEFAYQSSLELGDETFERIRPVPSARQIVAQARQNMVQRLNAYSMDHGGLFNSVIEMIQMEFVHILRRQALAGKAIIRSNNRLLSSKIALNMVLDILSERGYWVTLEVQQEMTPILVEPAVPGDFTGQRVRSEVNRVWKFEIEFPRPVIRRGD
jgi:adenylate kinase